jgi:DNA-binding NarL/FixJ family response regulator
MHTIKTTKTKETLADVINVAITDDHVLFRQGVKTALGMKKDIKILFEADNGMHLLNMLKHIQPDVILLDVSMPIMGGIETLPEVKRLYPHIKVIMLTMHDEHTMIAKLMELGANSYLTKNSDSELIYEAIKTCHEEEFFFNALTNKALIDGLKMKRQGEGPYAHEVKLNDKEVMVLKLMCEEKSTKEIADIVDLSPRTVEAIRDKLKTKIGARSTAGLILYAVKNNIIEG